MLPTWTSRKSARYVMISSAAVGEATPFWFDVAEEANWIDSMAKLDQTYGGVNVLVNNGRCLPGWRLRRSPWKIGTD